MKVEYYKNGEMKSFEGSVDEFHHFNSMFTCTIHATDLDLTVEDSNFPTVEWEKWMGESAKWIAMDEDGMIFTYSEKPTEFSNSWLDDTVEGHLKDVTMHSSGGFFDDFHWQDSLHRVI